MQEIETVIAPDGENIEVSTLTEPTLSVPYPETCLFFGRKRNGTMSRVVDTYIDYNNAIKGHKHWADKVRKEGVE